MINLGELEYEQGNLDQARHCWSQVAAAGSDMAERATRRLQQLDERVEQGQQDQAAATHFAEKGVSVHRPPSAAPSARSSTQPDPTQPTTD